MEELKEYTDEDHIDYIIDQIKNNRVAMIEHGEQFQPFNMFSAAMEKDSIINGILAYCVDNGVEAEKFIGHYKDGKECPMIRILSL